MREKSYKKKVGPLASVLLINGITRRRGTKITTWTLNKSVTTSERERKGGKRERKEREWDQRSPSLQFLL